MKLNNNMYLFGINYAIIDKKGVLMANIRWKQRFENLKKANINLVETSDCIKANGINKIYIMALIQAFEISFELGWKTIKDYLEYNGIHADTPRASIKEAYSANIINDGQSWIEMMETRNKTSHTYKEDFANQTALEILNNYIPLLLELEKFLEPKYNE